jgi:hypothetical protein
MEKQNDFNVDLVVPQRLVFGMQVSPRGGPFSANKAPSKSVKTPNQGSELLKKLFGSPKEAKKELKEMVESLGKVRDDFVKEVYDKVSKVKLSQEYFYALSDSPDWRLRAAVAKNPHTAQVTLEKLAMDKKDAVRKNVAENFSISEKLLKMLAKDKSASVRCAIASNKEFRYAYDAQVLLSEDKDAEVRTAVAKSPETREKILVTMYDKEKDLMVLNALEENKNFVKAMERRKLSREAQKFMDDVDDQLQDEGGRVDPDFLFENAHSEDEQVRRIIASMNSTPENLLLLLAGDKSELVRASVASNHQITKPVAKKLVKDSSKKVRFNLARNYHLDSIFVSNHLLSDKADDVRAMVVARLNSPSRLADVASKDKSKNVLMSVAYNDNTPKSTLRKLASHESYKVRRAVAENHQTPRVVLSELAKDENVLVAQAAIENPAIVYKGV